MFQREQHFFFFSLFFFFFVVRDGRYGVVAVLSNAKSCSGFIFECKDYIFFFFTISFLDGPYLCQVLIL